MKSLNFLTLILFYSSIIFYKSYGLNGTQLLEYALKQYSKLVKSVQIGAEYPTYGIPIEEKCTVANFSPEHSGTEKDQREYPLCWKSKIFIFII
jgi:hypothetical protein